MRYDVTRLIEINPFDAHLIVTALREPLARAVADLVLLRKAARGRLSDDELGEQANAWETMVSTYRDLVDRFDPDLWGRADGRTVRVPGGRDGRRGVR